MTTVTLPYSLYAQSILGGHMWRLRPCEEPSISAKIALYNNLIPAVYRGWCGLNELGNMFLTAS